MGCLSALVPHLQEGGGCHRLVGEAHSCRVTPEVQNAALRLAIDAWDARATSDQWVERLAPKWPPRRQPGVDRNLLRLAIYEITTGHAPPKVAIDEAIELAKSFSTEQSPAFVNGVLDAVLKEQQSLLKM